MVKPVSLTEGVLLYGPYPDKRVKGKWMMRVVDAQNGFDKKVVFFGTDSFAVYQALRSVLKQRLARLS